MAKPFEEALRHDPSSSTEEEEDDSEPEEEEYEEENNSEDGNSDDGEEESPSLWTELREAWRQHAVAVVVAVAATAFYYYSSGLNGSMSPNDSFSSTSTSLLERHSHLDGYQRTANISFCFGIGDDRDGRGPLSSFDLPGSNQLRRPQLVRMDFNIPKSLIPALKLHYVADLLEDDDYSRVLDSDADDYVQDQLSKGTVPALDCIDRLFHDSPQSHIKGYGHFFKDPEFDTLYRDEPNRGGVLGSMSRPHPAHLTFTGFAAKFFNLSPKPVLLFWDGRTAEQRKLVGEIAPFESLGTATTPGQSFSVSPVYDSSHALGRWVVTADDCLLYYEPDDVGSSLNLRQRNLYNLQKLNREFAKHYLIHSKRAWLANFPRPHPVHNMWPASHFGEVHTVRNGLSETYRLTVESVTPRVFSIEGFLSSDECDQLIQLALQQGLQASTVYSGSLAKQQRDLHTRSSMNTWLARSTANLTDRVYRRAASVLGIDEALLQAPVDDDERNLHAHSSSLAESLQVVRYKRKQEYTAHHDFVYPSQTHRLQPTRFATLLLYLNDDFTGGQTVFPRAVNAHFHDGISIEPKKGKAVLFYNVLPDGNVDDLSIHSSKPIEKGEKFLANLWIWEPVIN